jgi:transcriptional regulator with GAF, ATPase, and Fis domain
LSAMALAREIGDPSLVLEALEAVGSSYLADGQYEKAIECFEEGLGIARSLESKYDMAACYRELGTIYHNRADPRRALDCFSRSLELSFEIGDLKGIATSYNNLGIVYRIKDDLPRAAEYYKQAIDLFSRINDQPGMAAGMNNLSSILELDGKYDEALDYAFRALDKRKKVRSESGIAFCYYRVGKIYQAKGELDKAYGFAEKSLQIRSEVGDKMGIAYSRLLLAELSSNQGKYGEAFQLCQQGLEEFESIQNRVGILMSKAVLARILLRLGEVEKARNELEGCLELARESGQKTLVGGCLLSLGLVAMEEGNSRQAEEKLQEAQRLFRSNQNRRELVEALLGSCAAKLESRDLKEAGASLEEAYSIMEELGIRDLVPMYFLLRGEQEMASPEFDAEEAGKFLERGLVEARELNLPDLRWRFHYLQAVLEERRGDSKLSRIHFHEARAILDEICKALPPSLRKSFYKLGERQRVLSQVGASAPPGARASQQQGDGKAGAPGDPTPKPSTDELLVLHRETLKLHEIAAAMGSEPDLQKLLEGIMDAVLQLVDAERGFLILKDSKDDEKEAIEKGVIVARNLDREEILSPERKVSGSVSREVFETGKPVLSSNALSDTRFLTSKSIRDLRLRSLACVPLRFRREILGVIYLDNRHRRDAFRPEDMKILQAFADQAAVAVINARLIEENRRRAEELLDTNRKIETLNSKLRRTVSVRNAQLAMVREDLRDRQSQLESKFQFQNIVGHSEAIRQILRLLERVSSTQLPILLEGESGTGKALIARAIHFSSAHKQGRFVSMSCGAVTESLLETELFGHDRGAFTGAVSEAKGLFELANGGTLFLDDVEDMSLAMQQKLLRVLQEGEFRRVGGKDSIHVSVRVISACGGDLGALVKEGKFREDLYYRLNGIKIQVPSLRDRKEDIPLLVDHFVKDACLRSGAPLRKFHASALRLLSTHDWPGNVRELRHLVDRTLLTAPGDSITAEDLSFDALAPEAGGLPPGSGSGRRLAPQTEAASPTWRAARSLRDARNHSEKDYLASCLRDAAGNVSRAAKRCRVSRESFYRLLRKHGLRHGKRPDHQD